MASGSKDLSPYGVGTVLRVGPFPSAADLACEKCPLTCDQRSVQGCPHALILVDLRKAIYKYGMSIISPIMVNVKGSRTAKCVIRYSPTLWLIYLLPGDCRNHNSQGWGGVIDGQLEVATFGTDWPTTNRHVTPSAGWAGHFIGSRAR